MTANHRINADLLQRRFASLPQAGYAGRWAASEARVIRRPKLLEAGES